MVSMMADQTVCGRWEITSIKRCSLMWLHFNSPRYLRSLNLSSALLSCGTPSSAASSSAIAPLVTSQSASGKCSVLHPLAGLIYVGVLTERKYLMRCRLLLGASRKLLGFILEAMRGGIRGSRVDLLVFEGENDTLSD